MIRRVAIMALAVTAAVLAGFTSGNPLGTAPQAARAADIWDVQAGGGDLATGVAYQSYLPHLVTIHAGDTVRWTFAPGDLGFHTVTFEANQPPLTLITPGPGPGELTFGSAFFPYPPGPMPPSGPYNGATQVSSGTPQPGPEGEAPAPFTLTFTTPGLFTYVCSVHAGMHGAVQVLDPSAPLNETPVQAQARGQAEANELLMTAQGMMAQMQSGPPPVPTALPSGARLHMAAAGVSHAMGISILAFLPPSITVRRGDTVVWSMGDTFEIHTITFLSGGPAPAFPDVRPGPLGPDGPPLLAVAANVAGPAGGNVYTGTGYVNSGIIADGQSFALTFDAPAGTYTYQCLVHPSMMGTVTVTE